MRIETSEYKDLHGNIKFGCALYGKARFPKACAGFATAAERDARVEVYRGMIAEHEAKKAKRAAERKAGRAAVFAKGNPFKVGDVVRYSWGYDQTNVEYFQIVAATERTVDLRRIACESVPGSEGFMSDQVRPVKDSFLDDSHGLRCGKVIRKTLQAYAGGKEPYIPMPHGWCGKVDASETTYRSWYA